MKHFYINKEDIFYFAIPFIFSYARVNYLREAKIFNISFFQSIGDRCCLFGIEYDTRV